MVSTWQDEADQSFYHDAYDVKLAELQFYTPNNN